MSAITNVEAVSGHNGQPLIQARNLVKRFGDFVAVDGIDFDLQRGEAFGFLGPNGAGKTSTMRMIGCVSPVTDGSLRIFGLDPARDGVTIRGRLGVVPAAGHARHGADRPRERHHLRALLRHPAEGARCSRRRAARVRRAHRARERQGRAAVGRDEAPPDDRALARQRPGGHAARRADDGPRPAGAARRLGPPLPPQAAGSDAASSRRTTWTRPSSCATASS